MDFEDSFFDESDNETKRSTEKEHSTDADLFYYQGDHCESARLYKNLLDLVPKENGCVIRELRDALARNLLKIGHAEAAKTEVQQLVKPYIHSY